MPAQRRSPQMTRTRLIRGTPAPPRATRMMRPAQSQHSDHHGDADDHRELAEPVSGTRHARCRPTCRPAPCPSGTISTKRRAKRTPACLARASLRPCDVLDPVLDEGLEPPVEVGAAELVGDEQRLAGGVRGRVGQSGLQHDDGAGEVGREQPLAVGRLERRSQLGAGPPADFEQRLGDRAAERAGEETDLLDHPRPGLLRLGLPRAPAGTVGRGGNVAANAPTASAGSGPAEQRVRKGRADQEQDAGHGDELGRTDVVEPGLGQPLLASCAGPFASARRGAREPMPAPPKGACACTAGGRRTRRPRRGGDRSWPGCHVIARVGRRRLRAAPEVESRLAERHARSAPGRARSRPAVGRAPSGERAR